MNLVCYCMRSLCLADAFQLSHCCVNSTTDTDHTQYACSGEEEAEEMRRAEVDILTDLGWNPKGLIESANDILHSTTGTSLLSLFPHPDCINLFIYHIYDLFYYFYD